MWDAEANRWNITGNPSELKQTQEYPVGFGRAMAQMFGRHGHCCHAAEVADSVTEASLKVSISDIMSPVDPWHDAGMAGVVRFLNGDCEDGCICTDCSP